MTEWRFIRGVLPATALAPLFILMGLRQSFRKPAAPWESPPLKGKPGGAGVFANVLAFMMVAVIVYYVLTASELTPALDILPPFLPILMLLIGFILITRHSRDRLLRRQWEAQLCFIGPAPRTSPPPG